MGKMLIGALLALVVRTAPIGLVPVEALSGILGYVLIALGMGELDRAPSFQKGRRVACAAAAGCLLLVGVGMLNVKNEAYVLCSLAVMGIGAWTSWFIILGLGETEKQLGVPMNAEKMKVAWMIHVTSAVLTYWCSVQGLADVLAITVFVTPAAGAFCVILFYSGWRNYVDHTKGKNRLSQ